ncbi:MAG: reverse transcriptase family protein [Planctomycetaceae bacterium]
MARQRTDLNALWRNVQQAGGIEKYIQQQMQERGFEVERRDTAKMSKRDLDRYRRELKTEATERRRIRKEAWAAYHKNHIVHLGEGVFWNEMLDWDKWDLENAEERAAENQLPPIDSPKQLAELLGLSVSELRWLTYSRDAATRIHYTRFTIPKSDGSAREIWAPLPKLKEAQRWVLRNIVEKLPMHGAAHGFLPGRSVLSNAQQHRGSRILVNMDLKNFFPTVTYPRVKGVFRKAGYREQIATLLALLCTEPPRQIVEHDGQIYYVAIGKRCLPQGAPTSPGLTNTISLRVDRRLTGLAQKYGWRYSRYADDLTFSLPMSFDQPPHIGTMIGLVTRIVQDEGFQVNVKKTRVARAGGRQEVTGLVVNGTEGPRVSRTFKRRIRAAINNLSNGKPLRDGESLAHLSGYIAWIGMSDPPLGQALTAQLEQHIS